MQEAIDLAAVYERAVEIIEDRGWANSYTFRSGAPVDLPRALILAEKDTGWPMTRISAAELLAEHQQQTCSALSRELDQAQAIDLLRLAARSSEAFLAANPEGLVVNGPMIEHKPWTCWTCGAAIPVKRTRMPRYCGDCQAKRAEAKAATVKPRLCEGCGHDFGPGRGRAPKFCQPCKDARGLK